ncbi:MAG: heme exporter protein CcmB [Nitrospinaceae bacterium]|jgi:heme exporter protein B|nr:cytochrome C biogenesis protein [Nitrospinota bacterium]MDP7147321.1 heme exporter protein CcmB [Nitrospinaceae bacterium]MDP7556764.1 heme exporter protein CcmB [Nitrospinaceae bacterium]HAX47265.1 cytochrome C biogenesis protein [Nitrospina sp.]|tara:strand:- start:5362 stop:6042 length:681 start_codon:yes stop_codon:yes gene_type:complete
MNEYFNQVAAIVWKDFITELKTRELFSSMFIFALLVIIIFVFSVNLSIVGAREIGPGVLWVAFLFAGTIGLNRSFMLEKENGCLQGLLLAPLDRTALYFGKLVSNFVFLLIMEAFMLPLFMIFFNIDLIQHLLPLLYVILVGTLGFCAIGTLLSSLSVNLKTRDIMLPILLYPLMVPIVIGSVQMTGQVLSGEPLSDMMNWVSLTLCFDVIYIAVSIMTIDFVLEE